LYKYTFRPRRDQFNRSPTHALIAFIPHLAYWSLSSTSSNSTMDEDVPFVVLGLLGIKNLTEDDPEDIKKYEETKPAEAKERGDADLENIDRDNQTLRAESAVEDPQKQHNENRTEVRRSNEQQELDAEMGPNKHGKRRHHKPFGQERASKSSGRRSGSSDRGIDALSEHEFNEEVTEGKRDGQQERHGKSKEPNDRENQKPFL
jgi:hypothetical protein